MISLVKTEPNPQMVLLARLSRGLTQQALAQQLGVKQGTVSRMEAGSLPISDDDLTGLVRALRYPESFFQRREMVSGPGLAELYHARKRKTVPATTLHRAYAVATIQRMHVEQLLRAETDLDGASFPLYPHDEYGDVEQVARTVRAQLELPPGPIFNLTAVLEQAGALIVECDFESRHIDGFTQWRGPGQPPLFFINRHLPPDRWRWTLAHELGHAVLHTMSPSDAMEREADLFAEEFLMPRQSIKSQLLNVNFSKLANLKIHWKVSIQALVTRAYNLGLMSPRQRTYLFMQWSRAGYRLREPEHLDPPVEHPKALYDLVLKHLSVLGFTIAQLADWLSLLEAEFRRYYLPDHPTLQVLK
ncbi:MAG TPA: XRE family transcriptional regulator [Chloroflexota bacterium]|nr:XRE family transcriptional regulator [Chloroflexota bacterium]